MHVTGQFLVLAKVFIAHPAAMAGSAGARHGWGLHKQVTIQQTSAHAVRLADMAVAAGGVAGSAVVAKHGFQSWMILRHAAGIQNRPVSCLGSVEAGIKILAFLFMAVGTIL